jgi:hypothetical protein
VSHLDEIIAAVFKLAQDFGRLLRKRGGQVRLEQWKAAVQASEIAELIAFVDGLAEDAQAVSNGCSLTWSNGMVVGFINKVKSKSTCCLIPGRSMSLPFLKIFPGWSCRQRSPPPRISGTICPSWLMLFGAMAHQRPL